MKFRNLFAVLLVLCLALAAVLPAAATGAGGSTMSDGYDLVLATGITDGDKDVIAYEDTNVDSTIIYTYAPESVVKFYDFQTAGGIEWGKSECGGWVNMEYVTLYGDPIDLSTITAKGMKDGVAWILYTDGTLSLTEDCTSNNLNSSWPAGWRAYADQIKAVRFEPGSIGYVSNSSFHELPNLETVYVSSCPFSVHGIFHGCTNFTSYAVTDEANARYLAQDGLLLDKSTPGKLVSCPVGVKGVLQLPDGITELSQWAFLGCDQLEEVILPEGLDSIGDWAFSDCTGLKTITFPASTRWLSGDIFLGCTGLETIYFEGDAPDCASDVFGYTPPFGNYEEGRDPADTRITATAYYPADNPTWTDEAMEALGGNITWVPQGSESTVSEGVIAVGTVSSSTGTLNVRRGPSTAYEKVATLKNGDRVEIYETQTISGVKWGRIDVGWLSMAYIELDDVQPESSPIVDSGERNGYLLWWKFTEDGTLYLSGNCGVGAVGSDWYPWYQYQDRITDVVTIGNTPSISSGSFSGCTNLTRVVLCDSITSIHSSAFSGCKALETITIPAGVTEIQKYAFSGCAALKEVVLAPGSVLETIGKYAFTNTAIRSADLPDTVRTIEEGAFRNCADLATLTLRDGITFIGHYAFENCPSLTGELYLSETIEEIKMYAFDTAPGFTRVTINTNAAYDLDFTGSTVLTSVTYGGLARSTSKQVFQDCTALEEVIFDCSLLVIKEESFAGCTALKEITLPDTLSEIASSAFAGSGLTSIVIPDSVKDMNWRVFENCTALVEAHIGTGITSLDNSMFKNCTSLKTVTMPGVVELTYGGFSGCTSLENVNFSDDLYLIGQQVFSGCRSLRRVELPASLEDIYSQAFSGCTGLTEIVFTGDAPKINQTAFSGVTATAYYPGGNATWTEDVMLDYGGDLTWKPLGEEPEVVYGDLNSDGKVNTLDLILLRQHLAGWTVDIDTAAADVNADGRTNTLDLIILRQYLTGWDVTLGG